MMKHNTVLSILQFMGDELSGFSKTMEYVGEPVFMLMKSLHTAFYPVSM